MGTGIKIQQLIDPDTAWGEFITEAELPDVRLKEAEPSPACTFEPHDAVSLGALDGVADIYASVELVELATDPGERRGREADLVTEQRPRNRVRPQCV